MSFVGAFDRTGFDRVAGEDGISFVSRPRALVPTEPVFGAPFVGIWFESLRTLVPVPVQIKEFVRFAALDDSAPAGTSPTPGGLKTISATVDRGITDGFWTASIQLDDVAEIPIATLKAAKIVKRDHRGTPRCIFYGSIPGRRYQLACQDSETDVVGYDQMWYLSQQHVPHSLRIIPPPINPTLTVKAFLGAYLWETRTGLKPYRVKQVEAWGTPDLPAKQFEFTTKTTYHEALREMADYCGFIYHAKWLNLGTACTVDNPDPAHRLVRIEAEEYDPGGEGHGYHDIDTVNLGGAGRTAEGVDIEFMATEGGLNVGWIRDGEWLQFTRHFPFTGQYALQYRVASMGTLTYFDVYLDGVLQHRIHVGRDYRTGSYSSFTNTNPVADDSYIDVSAGEHVLKMVFGGNTENITPSQMHQNLGRIDAIPQAPSNPDDCRYVPIFYWIPEEDIDSRTDGLDLPDPVIIRGPGDYPEDGSVTLIEDTSEKYNRVIVRGHSESGVWFEHIAETPSVTAGTELAIETVEENDRCTTPALCQTYAEALLAFYQLDQRSWRMAMPQRLDLELYQKIKFEGHPKLPTDWCRITEIRHHVADADVSTTITIIPDQKLSAQRKLARMLFPTQRTNTQDVVTHVLERQPQILVGTCTAVGETTTATLLVESTGTPMNARIVAP